MFTRIFDLIKFSWRQSRFAWFNPIAGWWHPTMQSIYFQHLYDPEGGNYHVTQIFRTPGAFGLTKEEVKKTMAEEMGLPEDGISAGRRYERFVSGHVDQSNAVKQLALDKGWVMVHSFTDEIRIVAGTKDDAKAAVRDIELRIPQSGRWKIVVGYKGDYLDIDNENTMKSFIRS